MGALDHADPADRALTHVTGLAGIRYHVPNLDAIDQWITDLHNRLAKIHADGEHAPRTVARLRADIDTLLERRLWLQTTT